MSRGKLVMNLMRSMPGVSWMRASRSDRRSRRPSPMVVLVAVDGLAQQGDFLAALGGELADLGGDVLGRPALLRAAHAGHDAVGAELVAADHDADVGLERRRPHRRIAQRVVALEAALDLVARRLVAVQAQGQSAARRCARTSAISSGSRASWPVPQTMSTCGARRRISSWSFWAMQPRTPMIFSGMAPLVAAQPAQGAVDLVLGVLADAAGVEEDDVGRRSARGSARSPGGAGCRRPARCRARSSGSRRFRCRVSWPAWSPHSPGLAPAG